ncbi:hypothetical protein [Xanthomonas pisi]|nr:hypothetical protein [Xanthomonas pisi]
MIGGTICMIRSGLLFADNVISEVARSKPRCQLDDTNSLMYVEFVEFNADNGMTT